MTCKHCGADDHLSADCPALHMANFLLDREYDETRLPSHVSVMTEEELFEKTEEDLHAELVNLKKTRR